MEAATSECQLCCKQGSNTLGLTPTTVKKENKRVATYLSTLSLSDGSMEEAEEMSGSQVKYIR